MLGDMTMTRHNDLPSRDLAREEMAESMMLGANHLLDALNSGLTVAKAWEYAKAMAVRRAESEHILAGETRMSYEAAKAARKAIREQHGVTAWGEALALCGKRTLTEG